MEQTKLPDTDIKIFAGIGVFAILAMMVLPLLGVIYVGKEVARMQQCKARSAKDAGCKPGILWPFFTKVGAWADQETIKANQR